MWQMERTFDRHVSQDWVERVPGRERERDELAVEEPLEIRVDGAPLAVTMRTPGEDEELAAGFLAGEGLIAGPADIESIGPPADLAANIADVRTTRGLTRDPSAERSFHLTSSCGVCGKGALQYVRVAAPPVVAGGTLEVDAIVAAPSMLRGEQDAFDRTGGLHATGLFHADGTLIHVRED